MQRDELEEKARELVAPEAPVDSTAAKRMLDDGVLVVTATRVAFVYRSFDVIKHEVWARGAFGSAACEARFGECQLVLGEGGWREHRFTVDEAAGPRLAGLLAPAAAPPTPAAGSSYGAPQPVPSSPAAPAAAPAAAAAERADEAARRPDPSATEPRPPAAEASSFPARERAAWASPGGASPPALPDTPSRAPAPPRTSANPDLIAQLKSLDGELRAAFGRPTQVGCFSGPVLAAVSAAVSVGLGWPVVPMVVASFIGGGVWFVASIDAGDRWYYRHRMRERVEALLLTHRLSFADFVRLAQKELAESSSLRKNLEAEERGRDGVRRA